MAILLAVTGTIFDLRLADAIASLLRVPTFALQSNLLTFWIITSMIPVLLFPLLPYSIAG